MNPVFYLRDRVSIVRRAGTGREDDLAARGRHFEPRPCSILNNASHSRTKNPAKSRDNKHLTHLF